MTMQRRDTILHKGQEEIMWSQPLEHYFEKITRPFFYSFTTSMNMRGYYAKWKIENEKLFLIDLVGHQLTSNLKQLEFRLKDLFQDIEPPIFADWFSGDILIPVGENISKDIYPMYKRFSKLNFRNGQLSLEVEVNAEDLNR